MKPHSRQRLLAVAWVFLVSLVAGIFACAPSSEDCRDLMAAAVGPAVPAVPAVLAKTPAATRGCQATYDGVLIQVEAVRRNLRWERGRIWIDGLEASETDLPSALAAARARHAAAKLGAKAGEIVRSITDAAKSFRDSFRGQAQPAQPPPGQTPPQPPPP
ncbi:MAG TPA: hypothetical protein VKY89_02695 [Thermoanaerobaculia bacterium]|nr:hypothetical protein [Thermoanaerobaculia bacterium]